MPLVPLVPLVVLPVTLVLLPVMASMPPAVPSDEWEVEEGEEALPADLTDGEDICPCEVAVASGFPGDPGDIFIRLRGGSFSIVFTCNSGGGVRGVPVVNCCEW